MTGSDFDAAPVSRDAPLDYLVRLGVQFFLGSADVLTADFVEDADCNTGSNVERWRGVTSLVS